MWKKSFLAIAVIFAATLFLCSEAHAWIPGDYWLNFNPSAYTTEYFKRNGIKYGNCGGAALVIVEAHCKLKSSIPSNALSLKTDAMIKNFGNPPMRGIFYEFGVADIIKQLKTDGYNVVNRTTPTENIAKDVILDVISKKHWLIVLCRWNFNLTNNVGHYAPIYGVHWTGDVNTSTVNSIESYNTPYFDNPQQPNWSVMYRTDNMATVLKSVRSASSTYYNLIEVW